MPRSEPPFVRARVVRASPRPVDEPRPLLTDDDVGGVRVGVAQGVSGEVRESCGRCVLTQPVGGLLEFHIVRRALPGQPFQSRHDEWEVVRAWRVVGVAAVERVEADEVPSAGLEVPPHAGRNAAHVRADGRLSLLRPCPGVIRGQPLDVHLALLGRHARGDGGVEAGRHGLDTQERAGAGEYGALDIGGKVGEVDSAGRHERTFAEKQGWLRPARSVRSGAEFGTRSSGPELPCPSRCPPPPSIDTSHLQSSEA